MSFWGELKRRNVFRVGIAYLVASWLVLQVVDVVAPMLDLPNWVGRAILLMLAVGFVISLILGWAFELTPEGVKREKDVDRSQANADKTGRKLNVVIIAVLAVALAFFAYERFVLHEHEVPEAASVDVEKTIAVLPFVNMSADEEQEYFADGLTEELLNLLTRIPELRVTSRSSAFYYKGKDFRIADVGRELGVNHILEGSVRRSGDTIRITAQLIDVANDAHLWSATWDRTFDEVFEIQDEIAAAVVDELRVRLAGEVPRSPVVDSEAYPMYLQAGYLMRGRDVPGYERAKELLQTAIAIDPHFTAAWLRLGEIYAQGTGIGMFETEEALAGARHAANRAFELEPDNAYVYKLLAFIAQILEADIATARREITRALQLRPNDAEIVGHAAFIYARMGRLDEAKLLYDRASRLDPVSADGLYGLGLGMLAVGRINDAEAAFRKALQVAPEGSGFHQRLAWVHLLRGDYREALASAAKEREDGRRTSVKALIFQAMGESEQAIAEHEKLIAAGERWTYEIARMYAFRDMHDEAFHWLERAFARADSSLWFVSWDPFLDNIRDDPRFASVEERLYIDRD